MQKLVAILLIAAFGSAVAQDHVSTNSSGNYAMDLGQVYGAIRSAQFMGEICTESFPDQVQSNASAFKQWRANYLPFMQEIERHFSTMAWRESGGDPQKHVKVLVDAEKALDRYRLALKSQMTADGQESFLGQCKLYPTYLASDRMNLEHYYAEQVAVVRKGPSK
jgi:hypothetical protein